MGLAGPRGWAGAFGLEKGAPRAAVVSAVLWWFAVAAAVLWLSFTSMVNSDLWFHLAAGELILDTHTVPRVDTWSFTASGRTWHNPEWLADVVFAGLARIVGVHNLVFWQWTLILAAFLLLLGLLRRLGLATWFAALATVGAAALASPLFDLRPHLWTLLATVVVLRLGLLRDRLPTALPLGFALWANLHGGALFGVALLVILRLCRWAAQFARRAFDRAASIREGILLAISAGALCATPFGIDTVLFPLRLLQADSPSRRLLAEWVSPWQGGPLVSPFFPASVAAALLAGIIVLVRTRRRLDGQALGALAAAALTFAMASTSRRFVILFALGLAVLIAVAAREFRPFRAGKPSALLLAVVPPAAALVLALLRLAPMPLSGKAFIPTTRLGSLPVENLNYVMANGLHGKVFAYFLWGGYVDWRTRGNLRVFLDPRSEMVFAPATQVEYESIRTRAPGWMQALAATGSEFVLWPTRSQSRQQFVAPLVASGLWREVHEDAVSVLLARTDLTLPPPQQTPPSPYRDWARADTAAAAGRLAEAETLLEATLAAVPELDQACAMLVRVQAAQGKSAAARTTQQRCDAILP